MLGDSTFPLALIFGGIRVKGPQAWGPEGLASTPLVTWVTPNHSALGFPIPEMGEWLRSLLFRVSQPLANEPAICPSSWGGAAFSPPTDLEICELEVGWAYMEVPG